MISTDILIIGSGIAGSSAAISLAKAGYKILLLTRSPDPTESATKYAQGGIVTLGENDTQDLLAEDILRAGDGLCDPKAVRILVEDGPELVQKFLIETLGIPFSIGPSGDYDVTMEAAHSRRRILHVADATGLSIEQHLFKAIQKEKNIIVMPGYTAIDLITRSHHSTNPLAVYDDLTVGGVYALNNQTNHVETIFSAKTILASGGLGQLYLHTTNPEGSRGDGLAMAYRAGASLLNMEYIQFHPTHSITGIATAF